MFRAFLVLSSGSVIGKSLVFKRNSNGKTFGTGTYVAAYRVAQTAMLIPIVEFLTNSLKPVLSRYMSGMLKKIQKG